MVLVMKKRQEEILKAVVKDYINMAEPIGSQVLYEKYNLGISPATIRNELSVLEEEGYLVQPHTSAGRVPTDKGYRFYVDYLMGEETLDAKEIELIKKEYKKVTASIKEVLSCTLNLVSLITNYATIVVAPKLFSEILKFIHMVLIGVDKILIVLMINTGVTYDMLLDISDKIAQNDLDRISNLLNEKLKGQDISNINDKVVREIVEELPVYNNILNAVFEAFKKVEQVIKRKSNIYHKGVSEIIKLPEFKDFETMRNVIKILEEDKVLVALFDEFLSRENLSIKIGSENRMKELTDCSILAKTYKTKDDAKGVIGILGPKRMRYAHIKAVLDNIAISMSSVLDEEVSLSVSND